MNNPNPFIPQGTLLDQRNKKRARVKYAMLAILSCNILLVGGVLVSGGCRRSDQASNDTSTVDTSTAPTPPPETGPAPALATPGMGMTATNGSNVAPVAQTQVNPAPVVSAIAPPPATETEYTVVKGDKLGDIAKTHHVSLKDLLAANPGVVATKLQIGAKLKIPAASTSSTSATAAVDSGDTYTIKQGDTLTTIAKNHHTTVKELMALNNLKTTALKTGGKLKLPGAASATSAPVEPLPTSGAPTTTASNPSSGTPVIR